MATAANVLYHLRRTRTIRLKKRRKKLSQSLNLLHTNVIKLNRKGFGFIYRHARYQVLSTDTHAIRFYLQTRTLLGFIYRHARYQVLSTDTHAIRFYLQTRTLSGFTYRHARYQVISTDTHAIR